MKLLLDTHIFLWFIMGSPKLSAYARDLIEDGERKFVSVAGQIDDSRCKSWNPELG
jgi:PIN domain nuclease of toxin-antitoxin system